MDDKKKIEAKTAATILQEAETVVAGGMRLSVAPPSVATLIMASEAVSRMPPMELDGERVMEETLAVARDCRALGEVVAILVLGARRIRRRSWLPWRSGRRELSRLSRRLLEELGPRELHELVARLLLRMQVGDFFGLTAFLSGINLTRATKAETAATASGR